MIKRFFILLCGLGAIAVTFAQTAQRSYMCDFEDAAERNQWTLNPKLISSDLATEWYIGALGAMDGNYGLYVSADKGATVSYNATESWYVIACREITLEQGAYDFTCNWRNMGGKTNACLQVAWVPQTEWYGQMGGGTVDCITSGRGTVLPEAVRNNLLIFSNQHNNTALYGIDTWGYCNAKITSDGTPHKLVIVWWNEVASTPQPYATVDNIQISGSNCVEPHDLTVNANGVSATIEWQGNAEKYNFKYRMHGEDETVTITGLTESEISLSLPDGLYDFYVQNVCDGEVSIWYGFPVQVIYENTCFNYLDLKDGQCFKSSSAGSKTKFDNAKRIDFGYDNIASAHTMHYITSEEDPITFGSTDYQGNPVPPLKTVPEGELASVRIGSKENGQASKIIYDYVVDAKEASVLMLKYACVLQMAGHKGDEQPRFILNIKDALTGEILEPCAAADFSPEMNTVTEGWNYTGPVSSPLTWSWKDWTTVGINLDKYDGRQVRVEIISYGCSPQGHGGYAYFNLKCTNGAIEGINCGDTPTTEFIAPEGFHYRWYKAFDPAQTTLEKDGENNTLTEDSRIFHVDYRDTTTYKVDVVYLTDDHCGFTLTASALPRYPIPEATWEYTPKDCKNFVRFTNTSHIRTKNIETNTWTDTDMRPETFIWNFGNGMPLSVEWEPVVEFPHEGGTFTVELNAGVGLCDSTQYLTIVLPRVGDTTYVDDVQRCEGDSYSFQGRTYVTDTIVTTTYHTLAGCDSTYVLQLSFINKIEVRIDTAIVEGEVFLLGNSVLTQSGNYVSEGLTTVSGCDSIVYLTLKVVQKLRVENTYVDYPCADQTECLLYFVQQTGIVSEARLFFGAEAVEAGFSNLELPLKADAQGKIELAFPLPDNVRPDWYNVQIVFNSDENGTDTVDIEFMVRYAADIVAQRWNYVLGVHNAEWNGGYDFVAYQWYCNGEPLTGAVEPYYHADNVLAFDADYAVELFREGDARGVMSCAYRPVSVEPQISVQPTALERGTVLSVSVPEEASLQIFDVMGNPVFATILVQGINQLQPHLAQGCYILRVKTSVSGQTVTLMLQGK